MNKLNTNFTTNQTLTLQKFTWGGGYIIPIQNPYSIRILRRILFVKIILENMI